MLMSRYFLQTFLLSVSLASIASCALAFQSAAPLSSCSNAAGRSRHREPSSSLAVFPGLELIGQEGISRIGPEAVFDLSRLGLEGLGLEGLDLALALTSAAAAGAASQFPRISALEADRNRLNSELNEAKENLNAAREELRAKVERFEDSLFQMDQEFEEQTVEIKNEYDRTMKLELEELTFKIKEQYKIKALELEEQYERDMSMNLAMQDAKSKQGFLQEKLSFISRNEDVTRKRLSNILENQAKIAAANKELDETLIATQKELEAFRAKRSLADFFLGRRGKQKV